MKHPFLIFIFFRKIEKWTLTTHETTKELLDLKLEVDNLSYYPGLFLINSDYCATPDFQRKSMTVNKKSTNSRREGFRKKIKNV